MIERPLLLFPNPERAERETKSGGPPKEVKKPSFQNQYNRLQPTFRTLQLAFRQKNLQLQKSTNGINPDFALVFEVIGSVDNFYTAVRNVEGLEWIFGKDVSDFSPDDVFYEVDKKTGEKTQEMLDGKIYCIMANQQAIQQMLSLWKRYKNGKENVFARGFTGLRDIFVHIKNVRKWNAQDRIFETHAVEFWRESLEVEGTKNVAFEIELFYRFDSQKRNIAVQSIKEQVKSLQGNVIQECLIEEIFYHGLLVELPRRAIEQLITKYDEIELAQVDDIMFFRPTCQSVFMSEKDTIKLDVSATEYEMPTDEPVAALFDGMPLQNHPLLRGRVIIDDPDDYVKKYHSDDRVHGTAMTSLVIYGDLNRKEEPIGSPLYVRPVLQPISYFDGKVTECVPNKVLFIDLIHRAVKRMMDGEGGGEAIAPTVKIINLSIGDPVRQLASTMSPLAHLIDFLSFKYNILFIISAGNHEDTVSYVKQSFDEYKHVNLAERNKIIAKIVKENQRNLKVLAPAESVNSLTIGALYDDYSKSDESDRLLWAVEKGMISPISSVGKGYRSIINPDLFYNGGRKFLKSSFDGGLNWAITAHEPGCKTAAPYGTGDGYGESFSFGTSDAAAQVTHEAIKCYDVISKVYRDEMQEDIPENFKAIAIKAMLTHGASWENIANMLSTAMEESPTKLCKWIGNGIPNFNKVMECTKNRITLIGFGSLKNDEGDVFKLPLPIDFSSKLIKRRLVVTLAYLSPVNPNKQDYRTTQLWFTVDDDSKKVVPNRENTEWQAVRKGTLQHEVFMGEGTIVWNDDDPIMIKVNCTKDADNIKERLPYCLFVSFEIAEGMEVDLYASIANKIKQEVKIPII